ncbi:MAG: efflux RND transporter periplasmic adaptor subunit, partial [Pseudomonadota bacterium]|nr:efflux RND transporter periplasmic adaptor subunit [Pseudomonadota bacterium]
GFIQEVTVREGDRIAAGDLLVAIDPADVNGEIRRREAALESARADLADARRDVTQFTTLLDQGGIPADTLRKAQVRLSVAEAALAQAEAALHTALAQRRYTRIESPVDGVVVARERQPGDLATPGSPILVLESRQSLVFQTFVAERHIGAIAPGDAVTVHLDAVGRSVAGQVLRIVPSGDPATRRYEVKVSLPVDAALLPGMFGRAAFILGSREALLVPMAAFTERLGLDGVFVVEEPGVARFRWVRWRDAQSGFREVTAGLEPGERVILDPPEDLTDGAPVITDGSVHGAAPGLERGA